MSSKEDRLYARACDILEGRALGYGEPILWRLALRRYGPAMLMLANRASPSGTRSELGRQRDAFSPMGLAYRAYRLGEPNAAQNMAVSLFNIGDMRGYRLWMRRSAQAGNSSAATEVRRFEIRLPHGLARRLRRLRPYRRDGS
jgi:hypothetical protein